MAQIFKDIPTKKEFMRLYESFKTEEMKAKFGRLVRERLDEKRTRLDDIDDFCITFSDVTEIYNSLTAH